jgi:hypothetical protein
MAYLPTGVEFGEDFPEPIHYDPVARRLSYRGLMPHASYAYLRGLSVDLPYQMAIERLFVASSPPALRRESLTRWGAAAAAVAATVLVVWIAVSRPGGQQPLEDLIDTFDEPAVIVDADPNDAAADSPESSPLAPIDDEVGSG